MSRHEAIEDEVAQHYAHDNLERTILDALIASGKDINKLSSNDLAPIDEFHTGGRQATAEFAAQMNFSAGMHILDIGCGVGGASRFFAEKCKCHVTGVDITEDFVRTAEALARRIGIAERVVYRKASALSLPFAPRTFDGAYMMHVGMNIEDKPKLFAEVRRTLKDGGTFGIYDVVRTGKGDVNFPLPCALTPAICFIASAKDYRQALEGAGFGVWKVRDCADAARSFFRAEMARAGQNSDPPALGTHILLKHEEPKIFANVIRQFENGVLTPIEIICKAR